MQIALGPLLREVPPIFAELAKPLEAVLGGRVVLKGNGFVIEREDGELDIHLEAEGLRKFAQILQLIANGSIEPGGCLFWDEPEANMNPKLVVVMKDFLIGLAKAGVQVFIATHDYLLCRELSLVSEYGADRTEFRFFCLNKEQTPIRSRSRAARYWPIFSTTPLSKSSPPTTTAKPSCLREHLPPTRNSGRADLQRARSGVSLPDGWEVLHYDEDDYRTRASG